ncbi:hypothetical protein [Fodinibius sp. SL11]|uniref:hypothetical protein n=1 Tax=Fodinibius sp. SL11 TaxID=3425690 RepID=UPI003F880B7D
MKKLLSILAVAILITGCGISGSDDTPPVDTYIVQTMDTSSSNIEDIEKDITYEGASGEETMTTTDGTVVIDLDGSVSGGSISVTITDASSYDGRVKLSLIKNGDGEEIDRLVDFPEDGTLTLE